MTVKKSTHGKTGGQQHRPHRSDAGKPTVAYARSKRQYFVPSEDRHVSLCHVTLTFDLLTEK